MDSWDAADPKVRGKIGKPPPGNAMLVIAKEYGQAPGDVEKWEPYWQNRALLKLEGESIHNRRQSEKMKKKRR